MIIITPAWWTQTWFSGIPKISARNPPLLPESLDLLVDPPENHRSMIQKNSLKVVTWTISGKVYRPKKYKKGLQSFRQNPPKLAPLTIKSQLEANGLAGIVEGKYVPLDVI